MSAAVVARTRRHAVSPISEGALERHVGDDLVVLRAENERADAD